MMQSPIYADRTKYYGTVAQSIYKEACRLFGWDETKSVCFARQRLLYAEAATPEEYNVWFICHSNYTRTTGGVWKNQILSDRIIETWIEDPRDKPQDDIYRVTFAKTSNRDYAFIGVYKRSQTVETTADRQFKIKNTVIPAGSKIWERTFMLVSKEYPFDQREHDNPVKVENKNNSDNPVKVENKNNSDNPVKVGNKNNSDNPVKVGNKVYHEKFKTGVVESVKDNYFSCKFDDATRNFIWPQSFECGKLKLLCGEEKHC